MAGRGVDSDLSLPGYGSQPSAAPVAPPAKKDDAAKAIDVPAWRSRRRQRVDTDDESGIKGLGAMHIKGSGDDTDSDLSDRGDRRREAREAAIRRAAAEDLAKHQFDNVGGGENGNGQLKDVALTQKKGVPLDGFHPPWFDLDAHRKDWCFFCSYAVQAGESMTNPHYDAMFQLFLNLYGETSDEYACKKVAEYYKTNIQNRFVGEKEFTPEAVYIHFLIDCIPRQVAARYNDKAIFAIIQRLVRSQICVEDPLTGERTIDRSAAMMYTTFVKMQANIYKR